MTDEILFELQDGGIGLITFNRPDAMNTLSGAMMDGLGELYRRCDEDDDVRVVVVTGAGDAFCAGADMSGGGETFDADGKELDFSSCPLSFQAWDVRKPVIAAGEWRPQRGQGRASLRKCSSPRPSNHAPIP